MSAEELSFMEEVSITEMEAEQLPRTIKSTAPGCDNIPSWVFKTCSYELAGIIAFIINYTFRSGEVPSSWLTAIVIPVPKASSSQSLVDFRPVSVMPLLSRLVKWSLVRNWLRPPLADVDLLDQLAFHRYYKLRIN